MAFRDDREALRAKNEALVEELEEARGEVERLRVRVDARDEDPELTRARERIQALEHEVEALESRKPLIKQGTFFTIFGLALLIGGLAYVNVGSGPVLPAVIVTVAGALISVFGLANRR